MILHTLATMLMLVMLNNIEAMSDASTNSTTDSVKILAVSTIWGQESSTPIGSVMGGGTLYLKVLRSQKIISWAPTDEIDFQFQMNILIKSIHGLLSSLPSFC